jgi:dienelactone hydrolase
MIAYMRPRRRIFVLVAIGAMVALCAVLALPRLRALALIARVAGQGGALGVVARALAGEVHEESVVDLPARHGPLPARLYRPSGTVRRTVILVPGLHMDGIHEERLVRLARALAASGLAVLAVAPTALSRYVVTPDTVDDLEDAVSFAASRPSLAPDGRVGLAGISFAGGLALVAAGRVAVRNRIAFVLSFGGHADLPRTLRYLCLGQVDQVGAAARALVQGGERVRVPAPHDYGVVVALLNLADQMVPAAQVGPMQTAITTFLEASSIDRVDPSRAAAHFARARALGAALPEPARSLMGYVNDRDVAALGHALAPVVAVASWPAALSPEPSPPPGAPVFLLHGAEDGVVPATEMLRLAQRWQGRVAVRAFASRLISHAEANHTAALAEIWRLAGFWQRMLANQSRR